MKATSAPPAASLQLTRRFRAPRERVFRAFTEIEMLRRWWGPKGHVLSKAEIDLRPGGAYRFEMAVGGESPGAVRRVRGIFRDIRPFERLAYTWIWEQGEWAGIETLVTLEFREAGGETELVLTHGALPDEPATQAHRGGWSGALDRLDDALAGK